MINGLYLYLAVILAVFVFLGFKLFTKQRNTKRNYEEREDDVFYDAVKKIRRD